MHDIILDLLFLDNEKKKIKSVLFKNLFLKLKNQIWNFILKDHSFSIF